MSSLDKAIQTQIDNIQKKTGKSLDELAAIVKSSGLTKHGQIRDMLKRDLGLGHGDANTLVHVVLQSDGTRAAGGKCASLAAQVAHVTFYLEELERYIFYNDASRADWGEIRQALCTLK